MPPLRGCGTRVLNGMYAVTKIGIGGIPFHQCLIDPTIPISPADFGATAIGVKLFQRGDVWHILDIVGENFYPLPVDFIEEARLYGVSRRLPSNLDFSRLTKKSMLFLAHKKAFLSNAGDYAEHIDFSDLHCPTHHQEHAENLVAKNGDKHCVGYLWCDAEVRRNKDVLTQTKFAGLPGVMRRLASAEYYIAGARPVSPEYKTAIFMRVPITSLQVIGNVDGEAGKKADAISKKTKLNVEVSKN